jgi:hypothetical protein
VNQLAACGGQVQRVPPSIVRIGSARHRTQGFEVVDDTNDHAAVDSEASGEGLLRGGLIFF